MTLTVGNIVSSPIIYKVTQNSAAQVGIETGLKAVGRPGFIILDNNIDSQTKKYSAMKELLFQLTCLVVSLGVVIPVFKKGAFKIARKIFKDEAVFKLFKTPDQFKAFRELKKDKKITELSKINKKLKSNYKMEDINENLARGSIEVSSIFGSMLGLSALSPMISRPFVRPFLRFFNINDDKPVKDSKDQTISEK